MPGICSNYFKILGSVSPFPTKNSNCPGYLLKYGKEKILLDSGPGICSSLNIPADLNNLNIVISHFHKDHYSDLLSIAYASYVYNKLNLLDKKIKVYIPKVNKEDSSYYDYLMLVNFREHYFDIIEYDDINDFYINDLKVSFFKTFHPVTTYAVKLETNHFKFVYGADMGYKNVDVFCEFSKNANYLLLESSFIKSEEKNTEYHLSSEEAAQLAKMSGASQLILTHFWPDINKKLYLKEAKKIFKNTLIAKEGYVINITK